MPKLTLATLVDAVGQDMGRSDWVTVDQSKIDQFAECTGDRQWIHVDIERAKKESPFGSTIAHGYLSLSFVAPLSMELGLVPEDASAVFNYGLDKVRFITPVKSGDRVRLHVVISGVDPRGNGQFLLRSRSTVEIENNPSPALVAEMLALMIP